MERILNQLRAHADDAAPDNALLRDTISLLLDVQRHPDGPYPVSWDALYNNFQALRDRGLWERSAENDELLDALRILLTSPSNRSAQAPVEHPQRPLLGEKISIVIPPGQTVSSQLISNRDHLVLPAELVDILNNAYFLHILATDPTQVLPPGKSLLSVMSRSPTSSEGDTKPTLHSKVEDLVHKAFWDEAVDTFSNPEPSVQLSRIKLLYGDLYVALSPLLPPKHPVLVTLSNPLSPTSSPLNSTLMHLHEVLASLRERCAPVRDSEIGALQRLLVDPPIRSSRPVALATLVAETIKSILRLSEIMKDDLSQFFLGNMTEQQLRSVVAKQARTTEREIVIDIWRRERIMQGWVTWLDKLQPPAHLCSISAGPRFLWIVRVVQALGSSFPASCPLPSRTIQVLPTAPSGHDSDENTESSTPNVDTLPAVFFFSAPTLLKIQNYLQALVIAASLRILTRLPAPTRSSHFDSDPLDPDSFMSRVWTLLRAEIAGEPDASDTKLVNLADEVVRARIQATATATSSTPASTALSKEDEATLRAAVDRTLRPEDPVYKLLQRRLLTELSNVLVKRRQGDAAQDVGTGAGPAILRAGRDGERAGKRPRLVLDPEDMDELRTPLRSSPRMVIDVKGFEDPVLSRATAEVFEQVGSCLGWVESVWSDVIEVGNVKDVGNSPKKSGR